MTIRLVVTSAALAARAIDAQEAATAAQPAPVPAGPRPPSKHHHKAARRRQGLATAREQRRAEARAAKARR